MRFVFQRNADPFLKKTKNKTKKPLYSLKYFEQQSQSQTTREFLFYSIDNTAYISLQDSIRFH